MEILPVASLVSVADVSLVPVAVESRVDRIEWCTAANQTSKSLRGAIVFRQQLSYRLLYCLGLHYHHCQVLTRESCSVFLFAGKVRLPARSSKESDWSSEAVSVVAKPFVTRSTGSAARPLLCMQSITTNTNIPTASFFSIYQDARQRFSTKNTDEFLGCCFLNQHISQSSERQIIFAGDRDYYVPPSKTQTKKKPKQNPRSKAYQRYSERP